jgi:N-acyl homoserine lactone hydrolase
VRYLLILLCVLGCRRLDQVQVTLTPAAPVVSPISACWLEYTHNKQPGPLAYRGPIRHAVWNLTVSGILIKHPNGHLLIDVGAYSNSRKADLKEMNNFLDRTITRSVTRKKNSQTVLEALKSVSEDPTQIARVLLSHIHGDHAGGVVDLAPVSSFSVLIKQEDLNFAHDPDREGTLQVFSAHVKVIEERKELYNFVPTSYSIFSEHRDLFGDGSVVIVPLAGHTPGSVGVFLTLPSGKRVFYVGDAINAQEALDGPYGKSIILRHTDENHDDAEEITSMLGRLHLVDPTLIIIPAHDREAWLSLFKTPSSCIE